VLMPEEQEGCGMSTELRMEELKKPKKYTVEQKLGIVREWEKRGNGVACLGGLNYFRTRVSWGGPSSRR
jgi:hypothetical protein